MYAKNNKQINIWGIFLFTGYSLPFSWKVSQPELHTKGKTIKWATKRAVKEDDERKKKRMWGNNVENRFPPPHPVSRSYIFALWDGVQKVASAVHARISSCNSQAKLIVRSVVKWHEFHRNKTIATTLICYARLMQCSKPVKNRKKPVFLNYSSRFLDGFEWLSAQATFCTPAHTAKM